MELKPLLLHLFILLLITSTKSSPLKSMTTEPGEFSEGHETTLVLVQIIADKEWKFLLCLDEVIS